MGGSKQLLNQHFSKSLRPVVNPAEGDAQEPEFISTLRRFDFGITASRGVPE
jgi:hypothetical protein